MEVKPASSQLALARGDGLEEFKKQLPGGLGFRVYWVAVKELKLSYYIGETLLLTIYTHYGNLI